MVVAYFPSVDLADESGLLAIGGDLEVETLKVAYSNGIFPWPVPGEPLLWFAPPQRGILEFSELKIPKRLARFLKNCPFTFAVDQNFRGVVEACRSSRNRKNQPGTWITPEIVKAYQRFHQAGYAHSFEAYAGDQLVGGMYGVKLNHYFAGESMFYLKPNASKFVLVRTVEYLKLLGHTWLDVQTLSPLLKSFGAKEISRNMFMKKLQLSLQSTSSRA